MRQKGKFPLVLRKLILPWLLTKHKWKL
jgi:hypothetical protein